MTIFAPENYQPSQKMISPLMTIYGSVGVGKSTFAASFPKPFFFDFGAKTLIKHFIVL